jgi:hypothetical protein
MRTRRPPAGVMRRETTLAKHLYREAEPVGAGIGHPTILDSGQTSFVPTASRHDRPTPWRARRPRVACARQLAQRVPSFAHRRRLSQGFGDIPIVRVALRSFGADISAVEASSRAFTPYGVGHASYSLWDTPGLRSRWGDDAAAVRRCRRASCGRRVWRSVRASSRVRLRAVSCGVRSG